LGCRAKEKNLSFIQLKYVKIMYYEIMIVVKLTLNVVIDRRLVIG
jgi:hypothetical protein